MSTKVLVFESDAAFAGELRSELGKLGCSTSVVDDGNVGLQQASAEKPDLILLSIELPRMNGFSVCNKLKKDASLKDVPLIIMSSESSEETFEQHRKLRTRAEDYVHKPIAFGELLGHIQSFVQIGGTSYEGSDADGILIDDEIALQQVEEIDGDEEGSPAVSRPDLHEPKKAVDPDVDSFADEIFGRLQHGPTPTEPRLNGGVAGSPATTMGGAAEAAAKRASPEVEEKLRSEVDRQRNDLRHTESKVAALEKELREAHELISLHQSADERAQRELVELRNRASLVPKAAVSSREFLDLREALNKKDKEILALKTQLTLKDKEIFDIRDRSLALEKQTSEQDDRILAKDREVAETSDRVDELTESLASRETELADLRSLVAKAEAEASSTRTELADVQRTRALERESFEATVAGLKRENAEALEEQNERHRSELVARETDRVTQLERAREEREEALHQARRLAAADQAEAVAAREKSVREETDLSHQEELTRLRDSARAELEEVRQKASEALASRERELESRRTEEVASLSARAASELAEATGRVADLERDLDKAKKENQDLGNAKLAGDTQNRERIADLEAKLMDLSAIKASLDEELASARDRITALEADLGSVRDDLQSTQQRLAVQTARADRAFAKWDADRISLERAKDALAVVLAQLEETEARPIQDGG